MAAMKTEGKISIINMTNDNGEEEKIPRTLLTATTVIKYSDDREYSFENIWGYKSLNKKLQKQRNRK